MNFEKAANFIWENGRLLERRLFEYFFLGGSKDGVLQAIRAYQNEDGGIGHARLRKTPGFFPGVFPSC